ncbi:MAG TPA: class I tRNA ligase family protein, partial [Microthrixaceae bacterium]|nr:class I tRNA ligase family protein [Microthrixaceae bacterium]
MIDLVRAGALVVVVAWHWAFTTLRWDDGPKVSNPVGVTPGMWLATWFLQVMPLFFLVGGAKMSSSRGVGASARDMADLLPAEVLRFLMIRTKPNSPVNFDVHEEGIVKLFNEFDRYQQRAT